MLTLYLSTMGNLTGPSLDLLKFGKLSKCGMKGKPLKQQRQTAISKEVQYLSQGPR